jgi:hypothetical protein
MRPRLNLTSVGCFSPPVNIGTTGHREGVGEEAEIDGSNHHQSRKTHHQALRPHKTSSLASYVLFLSVMQSTNNHESLRHHMEQLGHPSHHLHCLLRIINFRSDGIHQNASRAHIQLCSIRRLARNLPASSAWPLPVRKSSTHHDIPNSQHPSVLSFFPLALTIFFVIFLVINLVEWRRFYYWFARPFPVSREAKALQSDLA